MTTVISTVAIALGRVTAPRSSDVACYPDTVVQLLLFHLGIIQGSCICTPFLMCSDSDMLTKLSLATLDHHAGYCRL